PDVDDGEALHLRLESVVRGLDPKAPCPGNFAVVVVHASGCARPAAVATAAEAQCRTPRLPMPDKMDEYIGSPGPGDASRQLGSLGIVVLPDGLLVPKISHRGTSVPEFKSLDMDRRRQGDRSGIFDANLAGPIFAVLPRRPGRWLVRVVVGSYRC